MEFSCYIPDFTVLDECYCVRWMWWITRSTVERMFHRHGMTANTGILTCGFMISFKYFISKRRNDSSIRISSFIILYPNGDLPKLFLCNCLVQHYSRNCPDLPWIVSHHKYKYLHAVFFYVFNIGHFHSLQKIY